MKRVPVLCVLVACFAPLPWPDATGQAVSIDELPEGLAASDWSNIRAAYEAGRHAVQPVEGGYRALNPGQQWRTRFDGRGFTTEPNAGSWTWGLQLLRYGFTGSERAVAQPASVSAEAGRVAYAWDELLTEWYVNDRRGLEHGYTVHERPLQGDEEGPLAFTIAVRGGLLPKVADDGLGVRFVHDDGAEVLTYSGLTVFDADGHRLPARFAAVVEGLRLAVDERGARYPLTIDPIAQQAYLKASNTDSYDYFGGALAMEGDTLVVGAGLEASRARGVGGNQHDNSYTGSGAAYVFVRNGVSWSQQAYLKASNTGAQDGFGFSVAVSGDTVVIGAVGEKSNATGVNGDQNNNLAKGAGAVYVFVRSGISWSQQAYLKASNTDALDSFGMSVAVSGDTVLIGASGEDSSATGVDGDQHDDLTTRAGAAYVFVRSGTSWSQQAYLKASNTGPIDLFGTSVALSGDTAVVGAFGEDSNATGVNGNQSNNGAVSSGAAYVFVRNGTTWSQQAYLKASNTNGADEFGRAVSVYGDTAVVGAVEEDSSATGVNGNQTDNSAKESGAAYVFVRNGTVWSQQAYLKASNTEAHDDFGRSLSLLGDTLVVGALDEDSSADGVNGDQSDNGARGAGAAYVFMRQGASWSQQAYLKASNSEGDPSLGGDAFGSSIAVSSDTIVVAADQEESGASGVNGDQSDNSAPHSGAVYVFDRFHHWGSLGNSLAGTHGAPVLTGSGTLVGGDPIVLSLSNALENKSAALVIGLTSTYARFKLGVMVPQPDFLVLGLSTDPVGQILLGSTWPPGIPAGTTTYYQYWITDPAAPAGFAASNAISGTTP